MVKYTYMGSPLQRLSSHFYGFLPDSSILFSQWLYTQDMARWAVKCTRLELRINKFHAQHHLWGVQIPGASLPWPLNSAQWPLIVVGKGKSVPLQAWSGPEGARKLRFPDFMTMAQGGGKVVSLKRRPPLPRGNSPGSHFC